MKWEEGAAKEDKGNKPSTARDAVENRMIEGWKSTRTILGQTEFNKQIAADTLIDGRHAYLIY